METDFAFAVWLFVLVVLVAVVRCNQKEVPPCEGRVELDHWPHDTLYVDGRMILMLPEPHWASEAEAMKCQWPVTPPAP